MSDKQNTKQRPRRSRMPQMVYETAYDADSRLSDSEAWLTHPAEPHDEKLCREIKSPLKRLADLADLELSKEITAHPHKAPSEVREVIREAMRLYYGLSDKKEAGEKLSAEDEARLLPMMETFTEIAKKVGAAKARGRDKHKAERQIKQEAAPEQSDDQDDDLFEWIKYSDDDEYALVYHTPDILIGDFTCIHVAGKERAVNWLVQLTERTKENITAKRRTGELITFAAEDCRIDGRVVAFENKASQPLKSPFPMRPETNISDEAQERIDELHEQLDKLLSEGEAHNESAIFRFETEIFNLEHPASDDDVLDADHIG